MASELNENGPRWNRWAPIVKTTPSGKILFVCLVCGRRTPAPNECSRNELAVSSSLDVAIDVRIPKGTNVALTCSEIERFINKQIATSLSTDLKLDWVENKLLPIKDQVCGICHGYGCQGCLGKGRRW